MNTIDAGQYLDLRGLAQLRHQARQTPEADATLRQVAEQFESLFVHMVLKSQRAATFGDPLFDSNALDTYRDMQDQQMALELARRGGFGLADVLVQQLGKFHNVGQPAEAEAADASVDTGAGAGGVSETALRFTPPVTLNREVGSDAQPALRPTVETAASALGFDPSDWPGVALDTVTPGARDAALAPHKPVEPVAVQTGAAPLEPLRGIPLAVSSHLSYRVEPARSGSPADAPAWSSPEQFVHAVMPHARSAAQAIGVDPRVLVAQAALETGWGQHVPHDARTAGFNLFGIKADARWQGERVAWNTLEHDGVEFRPTRAQFRAYAGVEQAVNDYVDFLRDNPRYEPALARAEDADAYVEALHAAGYATDPDYADKVLSILHGNRLNQAVATAEG
ncbi:MAG: flagellar assembly peptidoglycan hydrolase FlgJ [Pseudomonadota bacterium]